MPVGPARAARTLPDRMPARPDRRLHPAAGARAGARATTAAGRALLRRVPRIGGLFGPDRAALRQGLVVLVGNSLTSLVAGAFLGSLTGTFERFPGLLVMVPAAIGLRGNVFGAMGSRLSTAIHTGTFSLTPRVDTVVGQNVTASAVLTLVMSCVLALVATVGSVAFGLPRTVGYLDLAVIGVVGGLAASVVVLAATLALAAGSARRGWDLDTVAAPTVSTLGDVLTIPALWLATGLAGRGIATDLGGVVVTALAVGAVVWSLRSRFAELARIVRESLPILTVAGTLSTVGGVAIEKRLDAFVTFPAVLVMVPAFLSSAGALGGVLSSRLATKVHLGVVEPSPLPGRMARADMRFVAGLALPIAALNGVGAHLVAGLVGQRSPGLVDLVAVSLVGAVLLVTFVLAIAYYGTIAAVRLGLDPDTYGVPVVTSSIDLMGAFAVIVGLVVVGLA